MMETWLNLKTDAEVMNEMQIKVTELTEKVACLQDVIDEIAAEMCDNSEDVIDFEEAFQCNVSDKLYEEFLMIESIKKGNDNG